MTVNAGRRTRRRTPPAPKPEPIAPTESLAIGEINQTVFECPTCARPLAIGVRRCPGCGTRLILGVQLAKASLLTGAGVAIGLAVGTVLSFGLGIGRATAAPVGGGALPSQPATIGGGTLPSLAPTTSPQETATGGPNDMPAISRSALAQALMVNGRLSAGAATLRSLLDASASKFDAPTVAQTLRAMSADSVFGQQLAGRIDDWPGSATLGGDLNDLYDAVHQSATESLVASVRNPQAYRSAATAMLLVLDGLTALDAEAQSVAAQVGLLVTPPASAAP